MARPIWFVNLLKRFFPDRFWMAKLTHLPIVGSLVDYSLFRGDDIVYLAKDNVIPVNAEIHSPEEIVLPSQVVDHFIHAANYHWIMDFCICRESDQCEVYPHHLGCLFLGEAVLDINPKLGQLVSEEDALAHARRCREAGLVHMIGRNRLDMVWLGATPGEKLLTICNCCPCCCLWKMLPVIAPDIGKKIHKMPGIHVMVTDQCAGCGTCTDEICFVDAIHLENGQAVISEACRGCGHCVEICPNNAIEIMIESSSFVQQTIAEIKPLVDVS
jgi:ferredoxin